MLGQNPGDIWYTNQALVIQALGELEKYAEERHVMNPFIFEGFRQLEALIKKTEAQFGNKEQSREI